MVVVPSEVVGSVVVALIVVDVVATFAASISKQQYNRPTPSPISSTPLPSNSTPTPTWFT